MTANPVFISNVKNAVARVQNADGTAFVTALTPGSSGSRLRSLMATSDDTSARVLQLAITISTVDYIIGEVNVPAGAGTDGSTPGVNLLESTKMPFLQSDGVNRFMDIASGSVLKVKSKSAVTAGKTVYVLGEYGDI
jgi:hypothetical protein